MLSWWIIAILAVVLFFIIFKTQDLVYVFALIKKNLFLILLITLFLFVSFSVYKISTTYGVDYTSFDGLLKAGKLYFLWIKGVFVNLGKITGYAVQQDWVLNNATTNLTIK